MDPQVYEILQSYKMALDDIIQRLENIEKATAEKEVELNKKIDELNSVLFDDILNPAKEAMAHAEKERAYEDWNGRYAEKFAPYIDPSKTIEGDDFDLAREVFNNYMEIPEDERPEEGVYVDAAIAKVMEQIQSIKDKLGASNIELKIDDEGEQKVEVDGEETTVNDGGGESGKGVEIVDVDEEGEINSPDELKAFEEELEAQLPKK